MGRKNEVLIDEKVADILKNNPKKKKVFNQGYLYILPWFLGFAIFGLFPICLSLYMSFTDWPIIGTAKWVGLKNYVNLFSDEKFLESLYVTIRYGLISVPLTMAASCTVALVLNSKIKGLSFYRTVYYIPAVVSGVAVGVIWRWILDPGNGLVNGALGAFGIEGPGWLTDPAWVLPSYLMIAVWGAGGGMLTYLVALNEVPKDLYESANLQGAGYFKKLFKITLPLMKSILYYNLVMGIIGAFKKFTDAYILGGAGNQGKYVLLYLYDTAFRNFKMGYASAMSWLLLIVILLTTMLVFKFTDFWKYSQKNEE